ncbi:BRO family protein, partial [Paraburkholderia sp. GAS348]|uniref:BRO family protein n=1 Tax=Paraburkholderia sp. GAS348 TaxID=3035132 RepID=UPI003D1C787F
MTLTTNACNPLVAFGSNHTDLYQPRSVGEGAAYAHLLSFDGAAVRITTRGVDPWFNVNDVCAVLDFANPRQAVESHVDDDCDGLISSDRSIGGQSGIDEEKEQDDKKAPTI